MNEIKNTQLYDTMRQLGGGVDLGKLIAKDNFPTEVADLYWSVASKIIPFGNLTPAEIENIWAQIDAMELNEFKWMNEDELAEYDETYWPQIRVVMQAILSLARDGTLLKSSMSEASTQENGTGMMDKLGRFGGQGNPNEPGMIEKMGRWRQ